MALHRDIAHTRSSLRTAVWTGGGSLLVTLAVALAARSQFLWEWAWSSSSILYTFVTLSVLAGAIYLQVVGCLRGAAVTRVGLAWIILAGLLMRVVLLASAPVMETDSFRYMWDGALTAHGMSPYRHTPQEGKYALTHADGEPQLRSIAESAGPWLNHINHPEVKTIYPPVAQAAFGLAHWIGPWSGTAWRVVLLTFDLATLGLLLLLLRRLQLPLAWLAIYWWNPLVVRESYCAGHLDVIVLPFMMGALLLTVSGRTSWAAACLAGAVAAKLWPLILLPMLLRPVLRHPRRLVLALVVFTVTAGVLFLPMLLAGQSGIAGTQTYARSWQWNDGLFHLNVLFWREALPLLGLPPWAVQTAARWTTAALLVVLIAWLARKPLDHPHQLSEACLLATAGLYLLSPTPFPWYHTWIVPLLAVRPRWSLLLYTSLLPLYHLYNFNQVWVWAEHAPVWLLLASEWWWHRPRFIVPQSHEQEENAVHAQRVLPTPAF